MNAHVIFEYKPLPVFVEVGPSKIDGLGIIAKQFIPAQTNLGVSHVDAKNVAGFPRGVFHENIIRTPLGGFLNHSPNPNCILIQGPVLWTLWSTEDIYIGDELCVDYALYRCGYKVQGTECTD